MRAVILQRVMSCIRKRGGDGETELFCNGIHARLAVLIDFARPRVHAFGESIGEGAVGVGRGSFH